MQRLAEKLDIGENIISALEAKALLQPRVKEGKKFFSSRQAYHLRAALRFARRDKISLEEALRRVEDRWLAEARVTGN